MVFCGETGLLTQRRRPLKVMTGAEHEMVKRGVGIDPKMADVSLAREINVRVVELPLAE